MSLTNSQYDSIMRIYNERQLRQQRALDERKRTAYDRIPRLAEIDAEVAELSLRKAMSLMGHSSSPEPDLAAAIADRRQERRALLLSHHLPDNQLDLWYDCPACKDTGYVGHEKCRCFRQLEIRQLYSQSNLDQVLREENFDTFCLDYYSSRDEGKGFGSPRDAASHALRTARAFTASFGSEAGNLCITGEVGVGKTFLTHCIARELLDRGHSVLYLTAGELFEKLGQYTFSSSRDQADSHTAIFDCDLLIIDDLGTELVNTFVISQLFLVLNERAMKKKSVVLSTNLSLRDFADVYTERISSRIYGSYQIIQMFGSDIRIQKKSAGGSKTCQ